MRNKFVLFALIPAIVVGVVLYFFLDSWIESGLEYAGEKAVGAKVEIDKLKLTLSPIGMGFARLQIANPRDPWKNVFETGKVKFAMNFGQLLRGKFIIETMEVNSLILGTKRTTDGSIPQPANHEVAPAAATAVANAPVSVSEAAKPAMAKSEQKTPMFDIDRIKKELRLDTLLNVGNLRSLKLLDSLKQQIIDAGKQWDATLAEVDKSKQRLNEIESTVKSINVNDIKSVDAAQSTLEKVRNTYSSANDLVTTFNQQKSALATQVNTLSSSFGQIDDIAKQDFQFVVSLARLPDVNMKGLAELVLGRDVIKQVYEYLYYVDLARTKVPQYTSKPDQTQPKRMEGINVQFPVEHSYPKFWIQKILISGGTDAEQNPDYFFAKGEIRDISNDQRITGKPIVVALTATEGRGTRATFDASFDRRNEIPVDDYNVTLTGVPVGTLQTGRSDFLPSNISGAMLGASIGVNVPGNKFDGNIAAAFTGMKMNFEREPANMVERIVHDVLKSITAFNLKIRMWKNGEKFDVAFETNLDDMISSRAKKVVGDEIAKIQNDIRNRVNATIAEKRADVERLFNAKKEEINARITDYQKQLNDKLALVDLKKKEIEKRIDDEKNKKTDELKRKAEDALKGIFKR